jgi:cytochrome c oxidase cbb3-type subunit I/II
MLRLSLLLLAAGLSSALAQTASTPPTDAPPPPPPPPADSAAAPAEAPPLRASHPPVPIDEARASRGKTIYQRFCIDCHGANGDGRGSSAQWLEPRPRDFTGGVFKCRSTPSGSLPTDEDILRTERAGLAHTNMPSWEVLGTRNLRDLAEYLKTFSPRWKTEGPGDPIAYAPEPPDTPESRQKGQAAWTTQGCFNCHGQTGKGDGPAAPALVDDWGQRDVPFDFTSSPHRKCGNSDRDLYRTFLTGLNGTPMPSFADSISPEEAWHLVHFLKSLERDHGSTNLFHTSLGP